MMNARFRLAAAAAVVLLLAACGSTGGLGDILGGSGYPTTTQANTLQGTVNFVDTRNQTIDLSVNDYNNAARTMTVAYDSQTRVIYQNQSGNPSNLERGDRVEVQGVNDRSGRYVASTINVIQSMSSSYPGSSTYPSSTTRTVQGSVNFVDTQARRIDLSVSYISGLRSTPSTYSIYYDANTRVLYQGRTYSPADLERGDQVEIQVYDQGNNQFLANTVTVTRNVRQ